MSFLFNVKIAVFVPVFNEEDNIIRFLSPLVDWQKESEQTRKILVVNEVTVGKNVGVTANFSNQFFVPSVL